MDENTLGRLEHLKDEVADSRETLRVMDEGGGPASDLEAMDFQAGMTERFSAELDSITEILDDLVNAETRRDAGD